MPRAIRQSQPKAQIQPTSSPRQAAGIAFYLLGAFLFAANDALGKWLVVDFSVGELLLVRSIGGIAILLAIARCTGHRLALKG